jgi:hypothetical protein
MSETDLTPYTKGEIYSKYAFQLHKSNKLKRENESMRQSFNDAINFALDTDEGLEFLRAWREGDTSEWPEFDEVE